MTTTDVTLATRGDHLLGATVDGPDGTYRVQLLATGWICTCGRPHCSHMMHVEIELPFLRSR